MNIEKAVIAVAGYGTRWLPYTKAVEKCMVPILGRPIIDYVVEDCLKAGVSSIAFVVNPKHQNLRDYYSRYPSLENYLKERGKQAMIPLITPPANVTFEYIIQPLEKYGTSAPIAMSRQFVGDDEHFFFVSGDDFIFNADGSSEFLRLKEKVASSDAQCGIMTTKVPQSEISNYGVFIMEGEHFRGIVEKPSADEAPSNLSNISRYLLHRDVWPFIEEYMERDLGGQEYYITDVISEYARQYPVIVHEIKGSYLDGGTVENWLAANNHVRKMLHSK